MDPKNWPLHWNLQTMAMAINGKRIKGVDHSAIRENRGHGFVCLLVG